MIFQNLMWCVGGAASQHETGSCLFDVLWEVEGGASILLARGGTGTGRLSVSVNNVIWTKARLTNFPLCICICICILHMHLHMHLWIIDSQRRTPLSDMKSHTRHSKIKHLFTDTCEYILSPRNNNLENGYLHGGLHEGCRGTRG